MTILNAALALTDSLLVQWFALLAVICAAIYVAGRLLFAWNNRYLAGHVAEALDEKTEAWGDAA